MKVGDSYQPTQNSPQISAFFALANKMPKVTMWKYVLPRHFLGNVFAEAGRILY